MGTRRFLNGRRVRLATIALAAAVLIAGAPHAWAETITLRTAYPGPSTSPIAKCLFNWMAEGLQEKSAGRIKVRAFNGRNTFADQTKQYDQLVAGMLDYTYVVLQNHPGRFPLSSLITLPFTVSDRVAASRTLQEISKTHLADEFKDIHLLAIYTGAMADFHARKPIASFDDVKGLRMRAIGREVEQSARALGVDPVSIPLPSLYESLQRGVIDGGLLTGSAIAVFRLHEVTKHHYLANTIASATIFGMNKDSYNRLPDDLKAIVDEHFSGWPLAAHATKCFSDLDQFGIELAEKAGNTVTRASDADIAAARAALRPTTKQILDNFEAKGVPARTTYQALLDGMKRHSQ